MASFYQSRIRETLASAGYIGTDPRLVEAWMRLERGTLDGLSATQWNAEVLAGAQCVQAAPAESQELALSFGL